MALIPGTRLGPYEITAQIGVGGMGEVYRATDTRLKRQVAIKILPSSLAADPDRLARFQREAEVLASLTHPNIAAIYGLEDADGVTALVMELVEGDDLSQRIARGAVPLDEALAIGKQIAEALEAAHEQGIIHRDLKPANVKVRPDGTVKVLDFGLAKALEPTSARGIDATASPTITSPAMMTGVGVLLGTAAYMSPEQARGRPVDRRADIWAFGCVLYEMVAGVRPFAGEDTTETIAAIVRAEPDWSRLPRGIPESIRRALRRCLEKDPRRRIADIRDARLEIDDAPRGDSVVSSAPSTSRQRERFLWSASLITMAIVTGALFWQQQRTPAPAAREIHAEILAPPTSDPLSVALSPNGTNILFVASANGIPQLWLHSLETGLERPLRGTEGASHPFWSSDSRSIGFFAHERLYVMDDYTTGGVPKSIAFTPVPTGGTWNRDVILFQVVPDSPVFRVPARGGGEMAPIGQASGGPPSPGHRFPQFFPDGLHFLYFIQESKAVFLASIDGQVNRRLFDADAAAVVAPPDEVLFVRDGRLFRWRLDMTRLELLGEPSAVADNVAVSAFGVPTVSASAVGSLAYRSGSVDQLRTLIWYDRRGRELGNAAAPDNTAPAELSMTPDERVALNRSIDGNTDIFLLERGTFRKLTDNPGPDISPVFSRNGTEIVYSKGTGVGLFALHKRTTLQGAKATAIPVPSKVAIASDWCRDVVLYRTPDPRGWNIWAVPADGQGTAFPVLQSNLDERNGQFHPDCGWIAYEVSDGGRYEIYLHPFPGPGDPKPVSTGGGSKPRWNSNGRELFYVGADGQLMAVSVRLPSAGQPIAIDTPVPLFQTKVGTGSGHG